MRKISDARSSYLDINAMADDLRVTRSLRRPGGTITPWSGSHNIDHDMFACWGTGGTVVGAASAKALPTNCPPAKRRTRRTISLSDGARITFATAIQFDSVEIR
jgi:hypothetical protein